MNDTVDPGLRIPGVAHLCAAVAEVDGIASVDEHIAASHHSRRGRDVMNIAGNAEGDREAVRMTVCSMLGDPAFGTWSAERHLDEAVPLLRRARDSGDRDVRLTLARNEEGLAQVARVDGYIAKDSAFLTEIRRRIAESLQIP